MSNTAIARMSNKAGIMPSIQLYCVRGKAGVVIGVLTGVLTGTVTFFVGAGTCGSLTRILLNNGSPQLMLSLPFT